MAMTTTLSDQFIATFKVAYRLHLEAKDRLAYLSTRGRISRSNIWYYYYWQLRTMGSDADMIMLRLLSPQLARVMAEVEDEWRESEGERGGHD